MTNPDIEALIVRTVPSLRSIAPQGLIAGILPLIVYAIIRPHLSSDVEGLLIILVFPLAETAYEAVRAKRLEPIGVISMVGITLGVAGALALDGNALLLKVRNSAVTGAFGAGCLLSLALPRPAMWHLGRAFATEGDTNKQATFDTLWTVPGMARRFRIVTVAWGAVLLAEAAAQFAIALTLSTGNFLISSLVLNVGALIALLAGTRAFVRASQSLLTQSRARIETRIHESGGEEPHSERTRTRTPFRDTWATPIADVPE